MCIVSCEAGTSCTTELIRELRNKCLFQQWTFNFFITFLLIYFIYVGGLSEYGISDFADHSVGISVFVNLLSLNRDK